MKIFISLHCSDDFRFFDSKRLRQKILKECIQFIKELKLLLDLQIHVRCLEILSTEYVDFFLLYSHGYETMEVSPWREKK